MPITSDHTESRTSGGRVFAITSASAAVPKQPSAEPTKIPLKVFNRDRPRSRPNRLPPTAPVPVAGTITKSTTPR